MSASQELFSSESGLAENISEWQKIINTTEFINTTFSFADPYRSTSFYLKIYAICMGLIFTFGGVGNALTFIIFNLKKNKKRSFSVYMRALALSDSVVLLNETLNQCLTTFVDRRIIYSDDEICLLFLAWVDTWLTFSAILLTLISLDRYIAFIHPLKRDSLCTYSRAVRATVAAVIVSMGLHLGAFFLWKQLEKDAEMTALDWNDPDWTTNCPSMLDSKSFEVHKILSFVLVLLFPCCSIFVLNLRVLLVVKRAMRHKQETSFLAMIRATLPVLSLTISSALLLVPLVVILVLDIIVGDTYPELKNQIDSVFASSDLVLKINYAINFYIFIFAKNYRYSLKEAFCNCIRSAPMGTSSNHRA